MSDVSKLIVAVIIFALATGCIILAMKNAQDTGAVGNPIPAKVIEEEPDFKSVWLNYNVYTDPDTGYRVLIAIGGRDTDGSSPTIAVTPLPRLPKPAPTPSTPKPRTQPIPKKKVETKPKVERR